VRGYPEEKIQAKRKQAHVARQGLRDAMMAYCGIRACLVNPAFMTAAETSRGSGAEPQARILAPLVSEASEMTRLIEAFGTVASELGESAAIGAQIETPRACLTAGRIAGACDFVDMSTALQTELTFGMIRIDAPGGLLAWYADRKIMRPGVLDEPEAGTVGARMKKGIADACEAKAEVGIYRADFATPETLKTYAEYGVNAFIVKPSAVPMARLCAAKALLAVE